MKFIECTENDLVSGKYSPINVVFTLITTKNGYLFVHRKQWDIWELPVGEVNEGETLLDCASRRCKEESCQNVVNLKFLGLFEMQFEGKGSLNYFAAFTAEIESELPFYKNNDATEMRFVKSLNEISPICMTCKGIVEYYETGTTDFGFNDNH